jgi:hypothetical protein
LIQKRRKFTNLFISMELLWIFGGTVCNDCPTFWPGNLDGELWYSLMNMKHQIIMLMNLTISNKCILCILPNYGQCWRQWSRLTGFFGHGVLPALLKVTII